MDGISIQGQVLTQKANNKAACLAVQKNASYKNSIQFKTKPLFKKNGNQ